MMQINEQTHEQKVAMYMKSTKKQLIEMLIECNRHIDAMPPKVVFTKTTYSIKKKRSKLA